VNRNIQDVEVSPEGKRPLGRPRRRWGCNIRIDVKEIWVHLVQDCDQWLAVVNTVMNLGFHKRQRIFLTS
jgi:hypothetical protein